MKVNYLCAILIWILTLMVRSNSGFHIFDSTIDKFTKSLNASGPCEGAPVDSFQPHIDCTKFYVCPQGVVNSCPANLEFNPIERYCEPAHSAGCTSTTTDIPTTTTKKADAKPCDGAPIDSFQPHKECNKFYICPNGVVNYCPDGLEFNPIGKYCEAAHLAGCINNETNENTTKTTTPSITTTTPSFAPCEGVPINSQQPHEDCTKFYLCPSGIVENCPNGQEFNPIAKYCQKAHLAGCTSTGTTENSTVTPPITTTTPSTTESFDPCEGAPHNSQQPHADCTKFYLCPSGIVENCPNGQEFNPIAKYCQEAHLAGCTSTGTTENSTVTPPITTTTPSTTESFDPCEGAPHNSQQPHADCTKFYLCPSGIVENCPNGQEFNPIAKYCQEAHLAGCTSTGTTENSTVTPPITTTTPSTTESFDPCEGAPHNSQQPHADCTKFYLCPSGIVENCPNGQEFNPIAKYCQEAHLAGCTSTGTTENSTVTPPITTTTPSTTESFDPCEGAPFNSQQPHADCTKFYLCPSGIVENCPNGQEFNPIAKYCQEAHLAGCTSTGTTENSTVTPPITTTTPSTTESFDPCEGAPHNSQQPHADCTKFYLCPSGIVENCPNGQEFNPIAKYCQEAHLAGCTSTGTTENSTITPPITTTTPSTTESFDPCEGAPQNSQQPHADCTKFYLCPSGIVENCPNGQEFNPIAKYCQEAHLAGCTSTGTTENSTVTPPITTTTPSTTESFDPCEGAPHNSQQPHADCTKFYLCPSGIIENCPNGQEFNPIAKYCQEAHLAGCTSTGTTENSTITPPITTTTPSTTESFDPCEGAPFNSQQPHADCTKFYLCPSGIVENCPNGQEFNPIAKYCQEAHLAGCTSTGATDNSTITTPPDTTPTETTPSETTPTGTTTTITTLDPETTPTDDSTTQSTTTKTSSKPSNGICDGQPHGQLVPDPEDCCKFYVCDISPVSKTCPSGLHFNPKYQICDYPANAGCIQT